MSEKENEFKVIDRRGTKDDRPKPPTEGEKFVMKDSPSDEPPSPGEVDFSTLVLSPATGALIHLGLAPDPMTKQTQKNVELAKQNIEILDLLKQKTKGNLTPEENQLLENLLTETRLRFVEATSKK